LNYGLSANLFGGFEINLEGVVGSILILFFTILMGVLYYSNSHVPAPKEATIQLPVDPVDNNEQSVELSDNESDDRVYDYDYDYDYGEDLEDYYYDQGYEEEDQQAIEWLPPLAQGHANYYNIRHPSKL
jgi:hypothetical protein